MDEDYGETSFAGAEPEDIQDDMDVDGGNREDLDQEGGMEDRVELIAEAPAHAIDKSKRITTRYMTKYERARVLGTRALQIRSEQFQ
jgi:DNA-directed RNA polymerase I, II, and III subunit RPABC2